MCDSLTRPQLLDTLADHLCAIQTTHPLRVGIDGIDAAGKTTLADDLAGCVQGRGRPVIRASLDGFHQPRRVRYARGPLSPEGYYYDSFDYAAVTSALLIPLGPQGHRQYRTHAFDFRTDAPVAVPASTAPHDAILLFDAVFLLRPELVDYWDVTIFLQIAPEAALARALERDRALFGSAEAIYERYTRRYLPGQQIYLAQCHPEVRATIVIDNSDPAHPMLVRGCLKRS